MAIDALSGAKIYAATAKAMQSGGAEAGDKVDFGGLVQNAVQNVQKAASTAESAGMAAAAGRADLVDVVTAIAAAETSLETVMAVRDQVIQAYQEILRMPI
jgi:flagellar hook-basal body complex protein FliE